MTDRFALHVASDADDADAGFRAGLLRAIAQCDDLAQVAAFGAGDAQSRAFKDALRQLGYRGGVDHIAPGRPQDIERFGTLLQTSPDLARLAWRRLGLAGAGGRRYSLCGIAHATAAHADMSAIAGLLAAPLRSWDALICPSRVVRDSVRAILERQGAYLAARFGATRFELPQLPLIAPGVHSRDFVFDDAQRHGARARFGIGADDVAFLHAGRLSFHGDAHPQQMLVALERAAMAGRAVHLLLCGRFDEAGAEHGLREAAAVLAPSVKLTMLDAHPDHHVDAWAAADVFTAMADSVQDCAAPLLQAMAAGLPCVVSDWGAYRDTVRDGVEGIVIPTVMPGPGAGLDLAQRYDDGVDSYDQYCGHTSHAVAVDGAALAQAYERLSASAGLRRELGDNARRRAQGAHDWAVVLGRYRQLWSELDERRRADPVLTPAPAQVEPDRLDPFVLFASYPSARITPASLVELTPHASLALLRQYRELAINRFAQASLPTLEEFGLIFGSIESQPMQVDELLDTLGPCDRPTLLRGLAWLCKMDLLRISPPEET
ncbi:glycosyltransferase family 4 protein [Massilia sp. 9096]|uniref:glycosyltransferase family 4 protein n=1 Tax=Massilia sp. 9096 TaxID=1500894 RepID=UPI00068B3C47|nr:glycosyltransferase family 4 protein [Massilia sp. 9096]